MGSACGVQRSAQLCWAECRPGTAGRTRCSYSQAARADLLLARVEELLVTEHLKLESQSGADLCTKKGRLRGRCVHDALGLIDPMPLTVAHLTLHHLVRQVANTQPLLPAFDGVQQLFFRADAFDTHHSTLGVFYIAIEGLESALKFLVSPKALIPCTMQLRWGGAKGDKVIVSANNQPLCGRRVCAHACQHLGCLPARGAVQMSHKLFAILHFNIDGSSHQENAPRLRPSNCHRFSWTNDP